MMDGLEFLIAPVATVVVFAAALMALHWRDSRGRRLSVTQPAKRPAQTIL